MLLFYLVVAIPGGLALEVWGYGIQIQHHLWHYQYSQSQREILGFQTTNHPVIIGCWGREEIESNMSLPGCETAGAAL